MDISEPIDNWIFYRPTEQELLKRQKFLKTLPPERHTESPQCKRHA
jgi:hypothetical protein